MDFDERKAKNLEIGQDQRFRAAPDKTKFYQSQHERAITAQIRHHRRMSDTYDPKNPNNR